MPYSDPYPGRVLSILTYRSLTTSAVINLQPVRRASRYEHYDWWFSFGGRVKFGPYRDKMKAMLGAAHAIGKSGNGAAWHPVEID